MTQEEAIRILVMLINRLTLNPAEVYAANEAIKVLTPQKPPPAES